MPHRPPKKNKGPSLAMVPLVLPDGKMSEELKTAIKKYVQYLQDQREGCERSEITIPQTDEEFNTVPPMSRFRAWCHCGLGNALIADTIAHVIGDCGMALMAVAVTEPPSPIITP